MKKTADRNSSPVKFCFHAIAFIKLIVTAVAVVTFVQCIFSIDSVRKKQPKFIDLRGVVIGMLMLLMLVLAVVAVINCFRFRFFRKTAKDMKFFYLLYNNAAVSVALAFFGVLFLILMLSIINGKSDPLNEYEKVYMILGIIGTILFPVSSLSRLVFYHKASLSICPVSPTSAIPFPKRAALFYTVISIITAVFKTAVIILIAVFVFRSSDNRNDIPSYIFFCGYLALDIAAGIFEITAVLALRKSPACFSEPEPESE